MGLFVLVRVVASALRRNGQRTLLAVLAVSIGIAAVIATAALGNGSAERIKQQVDALGEDFLWIRAGSRNIGGTRTGAGGARTLVVDDAIALAENVPEITMCSPRSTGRTQLINGNQNWNTQYRGVSAPFFDIRNRSTIEGTVFTPSDEMQRARVVVLGPSVAQNLFGDQEAVGRTIRVGRFLFQVIGVLESKGASRGGLDRDDAVFLPITTARRSLNRQTWVEDIMCSVASPDLMERAEVQATSLLRDRHDLVDGDPDDFEIQKPLEILELRQQTAESMGLFLTAIGAVSLVVGGIGIMNIMLVSVTERRREIGVRLAIGARTSDIRLQFLVEAAAIGLAGGLAGIALGLMAGRVLSAYYGVPVVVSTDLVFWVTVAAVGAGLIFGYLPAHRASSLDPIQAVQSEP
jgi:putative ABC transport system permease protein